MAEETDAKGSEADIPAHLERATVAKDKGNEALKGGDLPKAIEFYEDALKVLDSAAAAVEQPKVLPINELVCYGDHRYARIDIANPHFGDYILLDNCSNSVVDHSVSSYERVPKHFKRGEITRCRQDVFDLRLACLQNLTLASLKNARGSTLAGDFADTLVRADAALAMDGVSVKALMRKGAALIGLRKYAPAVQALTLAAQNCPGKDPELEKLLAIATVEKGKASKGQSKGGQRKGGLVIPDMGKLRERKGPRYVEYIDSESPSCSGSDRDAEPGSPKAPGSEAGERDGAVTEAGEKDAAQGGASDDALPPVKDAASSTAAASGSDEAAKAAPDLCSTGSGGALAGRGAVALVAAVAMLLLVAGLASMVSPKSASEL